MIKVVFNMPILETFLNMKVKVKIVELLILFIANQKQQKTYLDFKVPLFFFSCHFFSYGGTSVARTLVACLPWMFRTRS